MWPFNRMASVAVCSYGIGLTNCEVNNVVVFQGQEIHPTF